MREPTFKPTKAMQAAAVRALKWRQKFNRGLATPVGLARARDLANGRALSLRTVRRMASYFARHQVDREAIGFFAGERGFPSAGRISWDGWGGDAGARTVARWLSLGE